MLYSVKYKRSNQWFWRTIKNLKGDGVALSSNEQAVNSRYFITSDEIRIEIPINDTIFIFPKERFFSIKENMETEVGQSIPVKT